MSQEIERQTVTGRVLPAANNRAVEREARQIGTDMVVAGMQINAIIRVGGYAMEQIDDLETYRRHIVKNDAVRQLQVSDIMETVLQQIGQVQRGMMGGRP